MNAILSTAQQLTGEFDLEQLLQRSIDHLLRLSAQDRGFIMIEDGDRLEIFAQRNFNPSADGEPYLSMSTVRYVFDSGEPIWISDIDTNEEFSAQKSIADLKLKTILCLPLSVGDKNIGVVYLDSRHIKHESIDRNAFEAIVGLCAVAIERARLSEAGHHTRVLATVGSVASNIAHDFKNAVHLIGVHADLLSESCSCPEAHKHIGQIQSAVDRLTNMSSEILDSASAKTVESSTINLSHFLNSEIAKWRPHAEKFSAELSGGGPDCTACIDMPKFASVIENLLTNSIDALADSQGERKIQVLWDSTPDSAVIKVIDSGKGIPERLLGKIFDPFFSYGKPQGTGLGLPTVKRIVEGHGGAISAESQAGQGTVITIWIPHAIADIAHTIDNAGKSGARID